MDEDAPIEEEIKHEDSTPTVIQQAEASGWQAGYYDFGKLEGQGTDFFNPSIIERPDGLWLLTRASGLHRQGFQYGQNSIIAFQLDETGKVPKMGKILRWPVDNPEQHFEDPRGVFNPDFNQVMLGCCTFLWNGPGDWTGPHQAFGVFDCVPSDLEKDWICKKMDYPLVGGNPGSMEKILEHKDYEKNWLWWIHDRQLHLLYKAAPWLVIQFGDRWSDRKEFKGNVVSWPNGEIRGGTPPVKVGDYYWTFHHSSLPWKGRYRRYYAGALAFDAKPPFTPRLITYQPLLTGSQNDPWAQHKPLVIFPCGAVIRDGTWLISCGINDMRAAWVEIPHEALLKRMQPIGKNDTFIFGANALSEAEIESRKKILTAVPVLAKPTANADTSPEVIAGAASGEARESKREGNRDPKADSRGGSQKLFGEALKQKQRENAAKARAARAAKRLAEIYHVENPNATFNHHPKPKKRRKRMRKRRTAQEKLYALEKFEAQKNLVPPVE